MSNPYELHGATAVELPAAEIREAEILDAASTPTDEVRCVIPEFDHRLTTDPCRFTPVSTKAGWFYPKKGDRAIVSQHEDGPDAILAWWPAAGAEPDETLVESSLPDSVVSSSPSPSGDETGATDGAALQAVLNAASKAAGATGNAVVQLLHDGTYFTDAPIYRPWNVSIKGLGQVLKAVAGFPKNSVLLQDAPPTKITAESNGQATNSATLHVESTVGYPSQGQIRAIYSGGVAVVNYSGKTANTFTGCTLVSGAGTWATGGKISARSANREVSGLILDSNNLAEHAWVEHFFAHLDANCTARNSLGDDVILGDPDAISSSYGFFGRSSLMVDRTAGSMPAGGHRCLYVTSSCTDGVLEPSEFKGQMIGIQCDGWDWEIKGAHPWSEGMETSIYDNGQYNRFPGYVADTPTKYGLLLGAEQNYGTYTDYLTYNNSIYGTDNKVVAIRNNGEGGQKNSFKGGSNIGADAEHRIANDYTGGKNGASFGDIRNQNVVAVQFRTMLTGSPGAGGVALALQVDSATDNEPFQIWDSSVANKRLSVDQSGRIKRNNAQATLNGTTSGSAIHSMPEIGPSYKKFLVNLSAYKNASGVNQTIAFPVAFTKTPYVAKDDSGGATVDTTTLTLPKEMGEAKTGWVVVEGY